MKPQLRPRVCDALFVECDVYECGAAHSSVGAGARDGRKARLGFGSKGTTSAGDGNGAASL
jgi:hypothetical protein